MIRRWLLCALLLLGSVFAFQAVVPVPRSQAALPPVRDFAVVTVSAGYDSAATSIVLTAGHGAKLPTTAEGNFYLVWWNSTDYGSPDLDPNVEVVRVTARVTDTLTVVRGQGRTSAVNHNTGGKTYQMYLSWLEVNNTAIQNEINAATGQIANVVKCSSFASCNAAVTDIAANERTLQLSETQTIASNLSIGSNIQVWPVGDPQFSLNAAVTLTFVNPRQLLQASQTAQLFAGAGSPTGVSFTKPGTVYPQWWGAVCDGSTDDGPEIQSAHDSLPAAGGTIDLRSCGTAKVNQEILITKSDVTVLLGSGSTIDITTIAGSGTSSIHSSDVVLAAFKVTGSRVKILGGRITGTATVSGKQTIGVLISGASQVRVGGMQIDGLFACAWAVANTISPLFQNLDCSGNSHGIQLGMWHTSASSPQVTRAALINVVSRNGGVGSGLNCGSYAYDTQIIGGEYASNAGHGINLYPGCQRTMVVSPWAHHNTGSGLYNIYGASTGTAAGKLGISSGVTLDGGQYDSNGGSNVAIYLPDYSLFSSVGGIEDVVIKGVQSYSSSQYGYQLGLVRSTVRGNLAKSNGYDGFVFYSNQDTSIQSNQSWDHGTGGDNRTAYIFLTSPTTGSTPPDNTRLDFTGNHGGDTRSGGSRTVNFALNLNAITNSHVAQNVMNNASNTDWQNTTGHTGLTLLQNSGTGAIGNAILRHLTGSTTWDPTSLATNAETSTTMTITGAAVGDRPICGHTQVTADLLQLTAIVSATNTVRVVLENISAGTIDVSSGTLTCEVFQ